MNGNIDAGPFSPLVERLVRDDFVILRHTVDKEMFGDTVLLLQRGATRIRVIKDRSQWFMEIAAPASETWFEPAVWLAMLDGEMPPLDVMTVAEKSRFASERLGEIDQASLDDSGRTLALLRSWRTRRVAARCAQQED